MVWANTCISGHVTVWSPLMLGNTLYFAKTYNHSKRYSHYMLQYYVVSVQNTVLVAYLYCIWFFNIALAWYIITLIINNEIFGSP